MEPSPSPEPPAELLLSFINQTTSGDIYSFIILGILLICSALISGSEVAFFSLTPAHLNKLKEERTGNSEVMLNMIEHPQKLLATILIANNFVNIAIVLLSTYIMDNLFDFSHTPLWLAFTFQVGLVTFLILLLGEVLPKVYATTYPLKLGSFMAHPLNFLMKLFSPLSALLMGGNRIILKAFKKKHSEFSPDELEHAIELTQEGSSTADENKILKGIARFGSTDVRQVMTARTDAVAFEYNTPYPDLLAGVVEHGYSRLPVYKESFDQIVGILYLKDLLPYTHLQSFDWQSLLRPPFFVPENKKIDDLLQEFKESKVHLAIVVDEYGGTLGIISLEDIIEEIVGEITDEFDEEEINYEKIDERTYIFEGKTSLIDMYRIVGIGGEAFEQEKGDAETIAGFILEIKGKIPKKQEKIKFGKYLFEIEAADKRRIKKVKIILAEDIAIKNEN